MVHNAFRDLHMTVEAMIAEGDKVIVQSMIRGLHQGDYLGVPATSREVAIAATDIFRIADGKLAEHWGIQDNVGWRSQLGVLPPS